MHVRLNWGPLLSWIRYSWIAGPPAQALHITRPSHGCTCTAPRSLWLHYRCTYSTYINKRPLAATAPRLSLASGLPSSRPALASTRTCVSVPVSARARLSPATTRRRRQRKRRGHGFNMRCCCDATYGARYSMYVFSVAGGGLSLLTKRQSRIPGLLAPTVLRPAVHAKPPAARCKGVHRPSLVLQSVPLRPPPSTGTATCAAYPWPTF